MPLDLLSYKPTVERYLRQTPGELASLSFAHIYIWQDFFQFHFEEIAGNLCVFAAEHAGMFLFLPPLGKTISPQAVDCCFERMRLTNKKSAVSRIENVSPKDIDAFSPDRFKIYKKGYEYLYYRQNLVELKASAYKSKRNAYNHFVKNFTARYRSYESSMAEECLALYASWEKKKRPAIKQEIDLALLEDSASVHRRVLRDFELAGIVGRVVEVNSKIVAYSFGYFVGAETFCVLLEVADIEYQGLSTYIFRQFCQDPVLRDVKFINAMDDFALENVNETKMSFRPCVLLPTYTVSLAG